MSHSFFNPFSWFSKAAAFALPLACLAVLGQAADLPPRSPQFTQLLEQLKQQIMQEVRSKIDQLISEQIAETGHAPKHETIARMFKEMIAKKQ